MPTTSFVDVAATDLVRSARAFEAGKIAFRDIGDVVSGELSRQNEWDAFCRWAKRYPGFVPAALRSSGDWQACKPGELTSVMSAWQAFRSGWLLALTHSWVSA